MKKLITIALGIFGMLGVGVYPAVAHVIVHPDQVGVASYQEFSMSVPSEKDSPTIALKLLIPGGVKNVTPNVKAGWTINEVKNGTGDNATVTEIDWTGGSIPPGQRDDFYFQAQVPSKATTLNWKAYQTYSDGSIVPWDHDPKLSKGPDDDSAPPPYSMTKVVNDLTGTTTTDQSMNMSPSQNTNTTNTATLLSSIALVLSIGAFGLALKKNK